MSRRKFVAFGVGSLAVSSLALTVAVLVAPAASAAKPGASRYGVINGTVNSATVHEVAGSTAFPNFTTGAVDNYYSMAHAQIDNSPFAEGTSSPADTGPIGQTAAASHFEQPQYADARWPGKSSGTTSYGKEGGPHAVANATSYKATADCSEASNGSPPTGISAPKGFNRRLQLAMAAWKAKWLGPLKLKVPSTGSKPKPPVHVPTVTVPTVTVPTTTVPTLPAARPGSSSQSAAAQPVALTSAAGSSSSSSSSRPPSSGSGSALLESSSVAEVDPQTSDVVTKGESSLGRVSIGGGQIVIRGVHVSVSVTNDGKPKDKVAVEIGMASIAGVPVTIDQHGVAVKGQGSNLPYAQADKALNSALKKAGVELHTAEPEVTKQPNEQTITATGVHVAFVQPVDAPGVPSQFVDHILGEVFVDSLAVPAVPIPSLGLGLTGGAGGAGLLSGGLISGGSSTGYAGSGGQLASSSGGLSQPASGGTATQAGSSLLSTLAHKPLWLLAAYLVWQTLMIGTAISLRTWRLGGAP